MNLAKGAIALGGVRGAGIPVWNSEGEPAPEEVLDQFELLLIAASRWSRAAGEDGGRGPQRIPMTNPPIVLS